MELVGFYMNKSRHNFRDADFETFADGKTRHAGLELQTHIPLGAGLSWQMAFTYAQHWYAFDHEPSGIKKATILTARRASCLTQSLLTPMSAGASPLNSSMSVIITPIPQTNILPRTLCF